MIYPPPCLEVQKERKAEGNDYLLDVFKISKGKEVSSPSSYFDVFKIRIERRRNDLNIKIYPYLKIDLQHWLMIYMINLLD